MKKVILMVLINMLLFATLSFAVNAESETRVLLNGKNVVFTDDTGYPYVDENNRTMVPLRVTMESAGFVVGYDSNKQTAIVITDRGRIEVPIGTNKIYYNNILKENDTVAVVKNGRTYLPIRAVLESAHYTVEWDDTLKMVNAYTYDYESTQFSPYSAGDLATLIDRVLNGDVVYVNGQYYATPDFVKRMNTVQVVYTDDDLNIALYPQASRYDMVDFDFNAAWEEQKNSKDWIKETELHQYAENWDFGYVVVDGELCRGFVKSSSLSGIVSEQYPLTDLSDNFEERDNAEGTFNGIKIKRENGEWFFYRADLVSKGIIK